MSEPHLSADFAIRVLEAADRVAARRRRQWLAGMSLLFIGGVATVLSLGFVSLPAGPLPAPKNAAAVALRPQANGQNNTVEGRPPNALSYFFPDADALARYASENNGDEDPGGAGALLADAE